MRPSAVADELARRGAVLDPRCESARALHFGDPEREADLAFERGVVLPPSGRAIVAVRGRERADFVNRMCTNDARKVTPGHGLGAVLTTAKGRIVDFVRIFSRDEELVLLGSEGRGGPIQRWLARYVVMEQLEISDLGASESSLKLFGPQAEAVLRSLLGVELSQPAGGFVVASAEFQGARVAALGRGPAPLYDIELIAPAAACAALFARLADAGLAPIGEQGFERVRVEWGIPAFGRELSENANPLEAGLLSAVSFEKGCYIGQEVVARLTNYSKVQRRLAGVRFPPSVDPAAVGEIFWELLRVGHASSAARSRRLGATLALAFVKTEYAKAGTPVYAVRDGEHLHGAICDLPFG